MKTQIKQTNAGGTNSLPSSIMTVSVSTYRLWLPVGTRMQDRGRQITVSSSVSSSSLSGFVKPADRGLTQLQTIADCLFLRNHHNLNFPLTTNILY